MKDGFTTIQIREADKKFLARLKKKKGHVGIYVTLQKINAMIQKHKLMEEL